MSKPKLIMMVGIPGSGKSSIVERLRDRTDAFVYSTDSYIENKAKEKGKTYDEIFKQEIKSATTHMNNTIKGIIKNRQNVIHDRTNINKNVRRKAMAIFPKEYEKHCIVFLPPRNEEEEEELYNRLANRPGKHIGKSVIDSMTNRFQMPEKSEGFDSITVRTILKDE